MSAIPKKHPAEPGAAAKTPRAAGESLEAPGETPGALAETLGASGETAGASGETLGETAEAGILARIFPRLPAAASALLGPGDDAAVVAAPDGRFVVTTDMMIHGPDFRFAWSTPHDLGWKAAASNLADVAAMGAVPTALVVAIAAPASTPVAVLEGIADGLRDGCQRMSPGCGVVGGDLSVSNTFTIAVTAFGDLQGRAPVTRSGANPGDIVAVSGQLGQAATGLRLLFAEGVGADREPDAERARALRRLHPEVRAQLAPHPPISSGADAAVAGATAMMDISDGLALDAARLARASSVAIDFSSRGLGPNPHDALSGGEDHSLLATFADERSVPAGFRGIGRVLAGSGLTLDGQPLDKFVPDAPEGDGVGGYEGWDPYRGWDGAGG